ncbi:MAG: hypothetical protein A2X36_11955 [Elusimicrobia bacterium GWA2_69_24]|nr:MAG: hypothetical protein A2X36_11955 [Elusimicrobia bacterium GWA2_69_24]
MGAALSPTRRRLIVYAGLLYILLQGGVAVYSRYLAAEKDRLDAVLRQQVLEHRSRAMAKRLRHMRYASVRG